MIDWLLLAQYLDTHPDLKVVVNVQEPMGDTGEYQTKEIEITGFELDQAAQRIYLTT